MSLVIDSCRILRHPFTVGTIAVLAIAAGVTELGERRRTASREARFDLLLSAATLKNAKPDAAKPAVVVVDIDAAATKRRGAWPWSREQLAQFIEAIARADPVAIGLDIVFVGPDTQSPAALARRLAGATGRSDLQQFASQLVDGDVRLSQALARKPTVAGFVLASESGMTLRPAPVITEGSIDLSAMWTAVGVLGMDPDRLAADSGFGVVSLPGDPDGTVRRVPLLVAAGSQVMPGLSAETLRVAQGAGSFLVRAEPERQFVIGDYTVPIGPEAFLRLLPSSERHRRARTVGANDVLDGAADARLHGAIVLVGSSSPESGGLRNAIDDALVASVQLHADALQQLMAGRAPSALPLGAIVLAAAAAVIGVAGVALGAFAPPAAGAAVSGALIGMLWLGALIAAYRDRLVDPFPASLAVAVGFVAAAGTAFARTRRREAVIRQRFGQHLAPAIVNRIVAQPHLVKLAGERREVTTMFTDIEDFTAMTHRAEPEALIAALDAYFEGIVGIVIAHGGLVDKFVGDAVHALFNVPLDLADHPQKALACAIEIRRWAAAFVSRPGPATLGFGRTRIGMETGVVTVGEVGLRTKLDFTAHGDAVNAASRLEAANKDLGSSICVGEVCASRCDPAMLRPLGWITLRGREEHMAVFEPWPGDTPADWQRRYLAAAERAGGSPALASAEFHKLAVERPDDPVPARFADRLTETTIAGGLEPMTRS